MHVKSHHLPRFDKQYYEQSHQILANLRKADTV